LAVSPVAAPSPKPVPTSLPVPSIVKVAEAAPSTKSNSLSVGNMAIRKKAKKTGKITAGGGLVQSGLSAGKKLLGGGGGGGRRNRGPAYWANKVLVAKLKAKYNKIKYAGLGGR